MIVQSLIRYDIDQGGTISGRLMVVRSAKVWSDGPLTDEA